MEETQEKSQKNKNPSYLRWLNAAAIFCVGVIAGFMLHKYSSSTVTGQSLSGHAIRAGGYQFINPLIDFDSPENTFVELKPFEQKIANFVNTANANSNHIDFVSVYFRDLNNGPWFGINETASFSPASLLKVPLMMAYYKLSESDPNILTQQISVTQEDLQPLVPNQQTFVPDVRLQIGKSYTVDQLINHMIAYSDNDATQLLIEHIDTGRLAQVYQDFGIELPNAEPSGTQVDVKTYAGFFRILFNASYLSKDNSEKALKLLSQVDFKDGLVAGVPGNITVAHKFGERVDNDGEHQLHDCGIVYYPNRPYLLCVMTRGDDFHELTKLIADVSQQVYQEIDKQYQGNK